MMSPEEIGNSIAISMGRLELEADWDELSQKIAQAIQEERERSEELVEALEDVIVGWGEDLDVINEEFDDEKELTKDRVEYYLNDFCKSDLCEFLARSLWAARQALQEYRGDK